MTTSTPPHRSLTAIVAATTSNGIGKDGGLPWRLPSEMKYFQRGKSTALYLKSLSEMLAHRHLNAVIMGRKTWESIPPKFRPLKDRQNIVVSRNGVDLGSAPMTTQHKSLESAIASVPPETRTFLMGGAQLYNLSLEASPPLVDRVLLTRVETDIECDTFLTDFVNRTNENGQKLWRLASHEELEEWVGFEVARGDIEEKGFKYRYEMWVSSEKQSS